MGRLLYLSGSRESNPGRTVPNRVHYHYATPRDSEYYTVRVVVNNLPHAHKSKTSFIYGHVRNYNKLGL